jgi:hypothetical protein
MTGGKELSLISAAIRGAPDDLVKLTINHYSFLSTPEDVVWRDLIRTVVHDRRGGVERSLGPFGGDANTSVGGNSLIQVTIIARAEPVVTLLVTSPSFM